jgi:chromosome segregation ATPase
MGDEEKKIPLPEAFQQLSTTLATHVDDIRTIQEKLDALQPQIQTQLNSIEEKTQQTMATIETNLKAVFNDKVGDLNQFMTEERSIRQESPN